VPVPEDVGTFVGKADSSRELYFYRPSYEVQNVPRIASPAGHKPEPITLARPPGELLSDYQWSPDSATLMAITYSSKDEQLRCWLLPLSGAAPRELKVEVPELTGFYRQSFDRSCRRLLFVAKDSSGQHSCFVASVSLEQGKIIGPANRLCPAGSPNPIWSPDGSRLVVVKEGKLWLVSPDGKEWSELPFKTESVNSPSWSPDGSQIAFMTFPGTRATLHVVPAKGGEPRTIYTWPGEEYKWDWAADGKSVTVVADGVLRNLSIAEGQTKDLLNLKELGFSGVNWLGWSPDGQRLAFYAVGSNKERDELFVMGAQDRTPRKLATEDRWPTRWVFGWSPDSQHIAYTYEDRVKKRPAGVLYRFDADDALKNVAAGAIPAMPVAERKPAEPKAATQAEPITGPVFTDNFDNGPSKHWRFQDFPDQELPPGHTVENGQLVLANARAYLDGLDWTDYIVTVRICMKEAVAFGEGVFGIVARTTPSNFGSGRMDNYSLYVACTNNAPVSLLLHMNYTDDSNTLRHDRLSRSAYSIVRDRWYTLTFEVRGQHLRGYLDGKLMVEATDARLSKGGVWLNTYKARALFDDFSVRQLP